MAATDRGGRQKREQEARQARGGDWSGSRGGAGRRTEGVKQEPGGRAKFDRL